METETKKAYKTITYRAALRWKSARRGEVTSDGKPVIEVAPPPEFKGEAGFWTPEDLFIASLNTCVMLTFIAYAQSKGLSFSAYESTVEGKLENVEGKYRFTEIKVVPRITVGAPEAADRARELMASAHRNCLISNSISAKVEVMPEVVVG